MVKRYFCDYCDRSFIDDFDSRKKHLKSVNHERNRKLHYLNCRDLKTLVEEESIKEECRRFRNKGYCPFEEICNFTHYSKLELQMLAAEGGEEEDQAEVEEAVTKIQAAFRGHRVRRQMASGEPTKEQLEAEFNADDKEMVHAATKIQATFRGHMSRKKDDEPAKPADDEEELDIDLTDPELNKAATKIQASFRGHKVRKDEPKPQ